MNDDELIETLKLLGAAEARRRSAVRHTAEEAAAERDVDRQVRRINHRSLREYDQAASRRSEEPARDALRAAFRRNA